MLAGQLSSMLASKTGNFEDGNMATTMKMNIFMLRQERKVADNADENVSLLISVESSCDCQRHCLCRSSHCTRRLCIDFASEKFSIELRCFCDSVADSGVGSG